MRWILGLLALAALPAQAQPVAQDWNFAPQMIAMPYVDMPYLVQVPGAIVSTVTISTAAEGAGTEQHVAVIRSTDNGVTWSAPIDLEPANYPESSWAMPYYDTANGKLYAFYIYNLSNVRSIPENDGTGSTTRVDSIGRIAYKVSADGGLTWGARQLVPPLPNRAIDLRNPFGGAHQLLWLFGHVQERDGKLYLGFSKMGTYLTGGGVTQALFADTEAFVLRMDIGASGLSNFTVLPDGTGAGIKAATPFWTGVATKVTEEPSIIVHPDGVLSVYSRTDTGRLVESYSTNGGANFAHDWARQANGTYTVYQPRGPAVVFQLPDGRFFLWTYNNEEGGFRSRATVWYRLGERVGNRIRFGAPKAFLFDADEDVALGYPSFLVSGSELLVAVSDKTSARLIRIPLAEID